MAIALVGVKGTFLNGSSSPQTPTFGQATTAGNLLICLTSIGNSNTSAPSISGVSNWYQGHVKTIKDGPVSSLEVAFWYKQNCAAGETAPTFTATGSNHLDCQLLEFSGASILPLVPPFDQTSFGISQGTNITTVTSTNNAVDLAGGELQLCCTLAVGASGAPQPWTDTYGSNATSIVTGSTVNTNAAWHSQFSYAITADNSVADTCTSVMTGWLGTNSFLMIVGSIKAYTLPSPVSYFALPRATN